MSLRALRAESLLFSTRPRRRQSKEGYPYPQGLCSGESTCPPTRGKRPKLTGLEGSNLPPSSSQAANSGSLATVAESCARPAAYPASTGLSHQSNSVSGFNLNWLPTSSVQSRKVSLHFYTEAGELRFRELLRARGLRFCANRDRWKCHAVGRIATLYGQARVDT